MSKPTDEEMALALREAARMRERGNDPKFVAKALLNLNYRINYFERMFKAAERYLYFGMEEVERQELVKEMENVRAEERRIANLEEEPPFGL